ncbi:MAG: hypothetical protein IJ418_15695, partial [Clostridia bacterium]|nr:hypothetical protein [Clostridia bacterium]
MRSDEAFPSGRAFLLHNRGIKVSKVFPNCAVAAASHHSLSLPSAASSLKREPSKNLFRIKKLFV